MKDIEIFSGNFLHIKRRNLFLPNKKNINIEFIFHYGAVMIIPFYSNDKIILIKQFRPVINDYLYEFPAGMIEKISENKFEDPLSCAKRELIEEIEYSANFLEAYNFIYLAPGYSTEKIYIFIAKDLIKNNSLEKDAEEIIEVKIFDKKEIKDLIDKNKIIDAKTLFGLSLIKWI